MVKDLVVADLQRCADMIYKDEVPSEYFVESRT